MLSKITRDHGMDWNEILEYEILIHKIVTKYASDPHLREDVISEVMLALYEDKRLDTSKFIKKDAAIRRGLERGGDIARRFLPGQADTKGARSLEALANRGMEVNIFGEWYCPIVLKRNFLDFYDPNEE